MRKFKSFTLAKPDIVYKRVCDYSKTPPLEKDLPSPSLSKTTYQALFLKDVLNKSNSPLIMITKHINRKI